MRKCRFNDLLNFFEMLNWWIDNKCIQIKISLEIVPAKRPVRKFCVKGDKV